MGKLLEMAKAKQQEEVKPTPIKRVVSKPIVKPKIETDQEIKREMEIDFDIDFTKIANSSEFLRFLYFCLKGKTIRGKTDKKTGKVYPSEMERIKFELMNELKGNKLFLERKELSENQ